MADLNGLVTIDNIVKQAQLLGNYDDSYYMKFSQIAINGLIDFNLFHIPNAVNTVKIEMNDRNYISLPSDYVSFIAIGIPYKGRLFTFTRDHKLVRTISIENGVETLVLSEGEGAIIDNGLLDGYGARGAKNQYYYDIDLKNRRIIINGIPRAEVQLQYISSGIHYDSTTYIPISAKNALVAYILFKYSLHDKTLNNNHRQLIKEDYISELNKLDSLNWPTIDELRDLFYSTFYQTPKR